VLPVGRARRIDRRHRRERDGRPFVPPVGDEPLAPPLAAFECELSDAEDRLGGDVGSAEPEIEPERLGVPWKLAGTEAVEEP
jgi:hypothetical protein